MIKACVALIFLTVLIAVTQGQDYLDGGYVAMAIMVRLASISRTQYFPLQDSHYVSPGPARHSATVGDIGLNLRQAKLPLAS